MAQQLRTLALLEDLGSVFSTQWVTTICNSSCRVPKPAFGLPQYQVRYGTHTVGKAFMDKINKKKNNKQHLSSFKKVQDRQEEPETTLRGK